MVQDLGALEQEVRRDPRMRRFHELAREYQRLGRMDEAAALCEKGLALNPNQWQARNLLAQIYLAKGRFDEARVQVEKVLLALPDNVPANHLAADLYYAMGDRERALRHYKVVDLFDPGRTNVAERLKELEQVEGPEAPASEAPAQEKAPMAEGPGPAPTPEEVFPAEGEASEVLAAEAPEADVFPPSAPEALPEPAALPSAGEVVAEAATLSPPAEGAGEPLPAGEGGAEGAKPVAEEASFLDLLDEGRQEEAPAGPPEAEATLLEDTEKDETLLSSDDTQEAVLELEGTPAPGGDGEELEAPAPAFNTVTLAQLYESQGYPEKAVEVYQRILLREPDNAEVREKVRALLRRMAGEAPEAPAVQEEDVRKALRRRRIEVLEGWLRRVREGSHV
ncbi:MAG: tetratricopeptide repeat protein [Acidobacteriota bacterium]